MLELFKRDILKHLIRYELNCPKFAFQNRPLQVRNVFKFHARSVCALNHLGVKVGLRQLDFANISKGGEKVDTRFGEVMTQTGEVVWRSQ